MKEWGWTGQGVLKGSREEGKQNALSGSPQSPGIEVESEERLQQIVCYRARDETGELQSEIVKEGKCIITNE